MKVKGRSYTTLTTGRWNVGQINSLLNSHYTAQVLQLKTTA
jgi:hypothetical protein